MRSKSITPHNKALVRTQTTLRFVCAAQLGRYVQQRLKWKNLNLNKTKDERIKVFCAECKRETNHLVLLSADINGREDYGEHDWIAWDSHNQIIQCQGCDSVSFRHTNSNSEDMVHLDNNEWDYAVHERLYPQRSQNTLVIKEYFNTPHNIRRIYREVIDCYNNESYTLCGAGLRAIIDGLCAANGVTDGPVERTKNDGTTEIVRKSNLEGQIAGLHEKGILTKQHSDILHEHRFMGNKAVHELDQPSQKELELAISIVEHTLENIYELPEKAAEIRARKKKRQGT